MAPLLGVEAPLPLRWFNLCWNSFLMTDSLLEFVLLLLLLLVLKTFDTEFGARTMEERLEVLLLEMLKEDLLDQLADESFLDLDPSKDAFKTCEEFGEDGVVVVMAACCG